MIFFNFEIRKISRGASFLEVDCMYNLRSPSAMGVERECQSARSIKRKSTKHEHIYIYVQIMGSARKALTRDFTKSKNVHPNPAILMAHSTRRLFSPSNFGETRPPFRYP